MTKKQTSLARPSSHKVRQPVGCTVVGKQFFCPSSYKRRVVERKSGKNTKHVFLGDTTEGKLWSSSCFENYTQIEQ